MWSDNAYYFLPNFLMKLNRYYYISQHCILYRIKEIFFSYYTHSYLMMSYSVNFSPDGIVVLDLQVFFKHENVSIYK